MISKIIPYLPKKARFFYYCRLLRPIKFPEIINIEDTNACNSKCVICPRESLTRKIGFMNEGLFKKIIDEAANRSEVKEVHLNGFGESLLDKDLVNKAAYAKQKGIKRVYFVTNASALTEDIAEGLIKAGLDALKISVYGATKNSYESVHKGLSFETVEGNIKGLFRIRQRLASKTPAVKLQFMPLELNKNEEAAFVKKWSPLIDTAKGDKIEISSLHNWTDGRKFNEQTGQKRTCMYPFVSIQILYDGFTALCCHDFNGKVIMGDLNRQSLYEVWNSKFYNSIRQIHKNRHFEKIQVCHTCDQLLVHLRKYYG